MSGLVADPVPDDVPTMGMPSDGRRWPHRLTVVVIAIGLIATIALFVVSRVNYLHSERRQVSTQTQLAGAALAVAPVDVQRRLGRAGTLVSATGKLSLFEDALAPSVPTPFVTVRLFHVVDGTPQLVDSLGDSPMLDVTSTQATDLLQKAISTGGLTVTWLRTDSEQHLGYATAATTLGQTYVVYAESTLPGNRRVQMAASSPLADMDFALYYGKDEAPSALLESSTDHLPISGTVARVDIPFGDVILHGVVAPRSPLLGMFAASVAWVILGAGTALTILMAFLTERLQRRRAVAEQLATVTGQLYRAQRGVSETLQTALLPKDLPTPPQLAVATRYLAGTEGIDVGGDWYDLVELSDNRLFFTIGDVSGRGLSAATMMSRLRHSITAYAVEGNDPATVLAKVSDLIDLGRDAHFATALCGILDLRTGGVTIANAGHPPLVLANGDAAETVQAPVGPPLGVGSEYENARIALTSGSVLLAYTDGLVERRGESIDAGIAHLCRVIGQTSDLEGLLDTVLDTLVPHGSAEDDTAILGLRWNP